MSDTPLSLAFYEGVAAVARVVGITPLPSGLNAAKVGSWQLTLNASNEPLTKEGSEVPIPPFNLLAEHDKYFVIALIGPDGGCIGGGITEDQFIADMQATAEVA